MLRPNPVVVSDQIEFLRAEVLVLRASVNALVGTLTKVAPETVDVLPRALEVVTADLRRPDAPKLPWGTIELMDDFVKDVRGIIDAARSR